ncbi:MAG TPA: acetoacetate--CoA ligase, partial [Azospirillaceae bacterium]|nr:acetoacetate--CoA ligase [Azospirillaceae bacterium]
RALVNQRHGLALESFDDLWRWSVDQSESFWRLVWDWAGVVGEPGERVLIDGDKMPGARWFPDAKLNYAENLLAGAPDDAVVFWGEDKVKRRWSKAELLAEVSRLQQALRALGVGVGDRVAAYMPNMPETLAAMLATASLGAVWSSCSPDFGVQGVVDRFGQIEPKVLFFPDGYWYNGKAHDVTAKAAEALAALPSVKAAVCVAYAGGGDIAAVPKGASYADFLAPYAAAEVTFERLPFNHPLFILYSSGTTGKPKCIVHGAGGTLLQHLKEHKLHCDLKAGDRLFYFSTCGWMMWNWLVTGLAAGCTLLLFDGSPFAPDHNILFDYADAENMTLFGTSAKYIQTLEKAHAEPIKTHSLASVRVLTSTGSPLMPENFDYVYRAIKADVHLASISGGTDIVSCFVLGNPEGAVWKGEIQARGLGLAVAAFDDDGKPAPAGEKGELVCTQPFPSMPVGFWDDPDGSRYRAAYFERFANVWTHGDFIAQTEHGGWVIYGRSDAVLNPGGVRIGTAEIYRQVEQLPQILESICIGQEWGDDVRVVLFVTLRPGAALDKALEDAIRKRIKDNCSPRHVPAKIVQVTDIPRTRSGKITELAVRDVVHGRAVKNTEALANPEALDQFRGRQELAG